MGELRPHLPRLADFGAEVWLIGNGTGEQARAFAAEHGLEGMPGITVAVDPGLAAYRAAGLARGFLATAGPRALFDLGRALARGYVQTGVHGDKLQQGGTLVFARGGELVLDHANRSLGGHLRAEKLVAAVAAAAAATPR